MLSQPTIERGMYAYIHTHTHAQNRSIYVLIYVLSYLSHLSFTQKEPYICAQKPYICAKEPCIRVLRLVSIYSSKRLD